MIKSVALMLKHSITHVDCITTTLHANISPTMILLLLLLLLLLLPVVVVVLLWISLKKVKQTILSINEPTNL